jgi:hypothetical protein
MHCLAEVIKGELSLDGVSLAPKPESERAAAIAYLEAYEADVLATRRAGHEPDARTFVEWLAREEHVALPSERAAGAFDEIPMEDAAQLYEILLESDDIEDLFVSERELTRLLARFRARFTPR